MPPDLHEPVISYSIRDLFERLEFKLDNKFETLTDAIRSKASAEDMATVMARQIKTDDRLKSVEGTLAQQDKRTTWRIEWRRWFVTTIITAALVAVTLIQTLHG